ncbi:Uncharacterized iron-regulated membrane protein [Stigmatella aurantiaca]|uniref:Uncharacterized iron-regulated membrane protein n=1 Tax=Stigmatella aurantiaca TaxID=41 RepID=A0A1H7JUL9_STIAU|nr:PepSY-associated TM helix domain-containing protein [Stigmatella aurantiaca]SEK78421.1 Uncharacterized iron-regulated membrane protein [Stigmatella aurantiaca]
MSLRQAMAGLHTWAGLLVSWLLFTILFAGSLACFDKELTRWMQPALHLSTGPRATTDQVRDWMHRQAPDAHAWWMRPPGPREPWWRVGYEPDGGLFQGFELDAVSGQPLPKTAGGDFFFTLHYDLHAGLNGMYVVGGAGILMLVSLLSGLVIHRRIFQDFFTLRPQATRQRAWLDAHNVLGVLGLPFHLLIAYTGLAIFVFTYMDAGLKVAYAGDAERFQTEVQRSWEREDIGQPAPPPVSLDGLIAEAQRTWGDGGNAGWISVHHPADAAAVVSIRRRDDSRITDDQRTVSFDAGTGALLHVQPPYDPGYRLYAWMTGLHMAQYGGQLVRGLYLLLGLAGCLMLVSGVQLWLAKREARGVPGMALVRVLNGAVMGGLPLASLALLWANRLVPPELPGREVWEVRAFLATWTVAIAWAVLRSRGGRLTRDQLVVGAVLALGLPLVSIVRAPQGHLGASLTRGDWGLAAVDLSLLGTGILCGWLSWRLSRPKASVSEPSSRLAEEGA